MTPTTRGLVVTGGLWNNEALEKASQTRLGPGHDVAADNKKQGTLDVAESNGRTLAVTVTLVE